MEEAGEIPANDDPGRFADSGRQAHLDKDEQVAIGHKADSEICHELKVVPTNGIDNSR